MIYEEIQAERDRQKSLGSEDLDPTNTQADWMAYICYYATDSHNKLFKPSGRSFRDCMVKVAALAVAAIESHDQGHC